MKRITFLLLILLLISSVVLSVPGGLLAAEILPGPVCPHCQMAGHCDGHGPCCQHHGKPIHCGTSGRGGMTCCFPNSVSPAVISPGICGVPVWQESPFALAIATVSSNLIPLSIFHPPEISHFSA